MPKIDFVFLRIIIAINVIEIIVLDYKKKWLSFVPLYKRTAQIFKWTNIVQSHGKPFSFAYYVYPLWQRKIPGRKTVEAEIHKNFSY